MPNSAPGVSEVMPLHHKHQGKSIMASSTGEAALTDEEITILEDTSLTPSVAEANNNLNTGDNHTGFLLKDPSITKLTAEKLNEDVVEKCTVFVPFIKLPEATAVWCMFHCQYSCPCSMYKDPLDYGPDRNWRPSKRKLLDFKDRPRPLRMKVSFGLLTEEELLEFEQFPNKAKHDLLEHSARTAGFQGLPRTTKVKPVHRIERVPCSPKKQISEKETLDSVKENRPPKRPPVVQQQQQPYPPQLMTNTPAASAEDAVMAAFANANKLDLTIKPKNSIQYVKWAVLKRDFETDVVKIFAFLR